MHLNEPRLSEPIVDENNICLPACS